MAIKRNGRDAALHGEKIQVTRRRGETSCNEHWHDYYEMIHYRECRGKCILNGREHPVSENCIFLMSPKDFHKTDNVASKSSNSVLVQFSEQAIDAKLLSILNAGPIVLYNPSKRIADHIDELDSTMHKNTRFKDEYQTNLLGCILINLIEEGTCISSNEGKRDPVVREAIAFMLSNLQKNISLTAIAERYNLSPTYFSHLFHDSTGTPFKKYLTNLRIEYAKRMLEGSDTPIIDVGFECGFRTPSQFVRTFKGATGDAPSVYRKKKRKSAEKQT